MKSDPRERTVAIRDALWPLVDVLSTHALPAEPVFPSRCTNRPLTARTAARIVRRAAEQAGIEKIVTCAVLRHSYAVSRLRGGMNVRELQIALGHQRVASTLAYVRHLLPVGTHSPLDRLPVGAVQSVLTGQSPTLTAGP